MIDGMLLDHDRLEQPRDYVWAKVDDTILIRSPYPREKFFSPVEIPLEGTITFQFDAAPKHGHPANHYRRSTRRSFAPEEFGSWVPVKLRQDCGIMVSDVEHFPYLAALSGLPPRVAAFIVGVGKIVDPALYREAVIKGIRGGGPKCWGFGALVINWR